MLRLIQNIIKGSISVTGTQTASVSISYNQCLNLFQAKVGNLQNFWTEWMSKSWLNDLFFFIVFHYFLSLVVVERLNWRLLGFTYIWPLFMIKRFHLQNVHNSRIFNTSVLNMNNSNWQKKLHIKVSTKYSKTVKNILVSKIKFFMIST